MSSDVNEGHFALLWGCQYFFIGKLVTVLSYHKPLVSVSDNSMSYRNTRPEQYNLKLSAYNATIQHTLVVCVELSRTAAPSVTLGATKLVEYLCHPVIVSIAI
jgi:hypothetical protein